MMFEGSRQNHAEGGDWLKFFVKDKFPEVGTPFIQEPNLFTHVVNVCEALRYAPILHRMTKDPRHLQQTHDAVEMTCKYHGSRSGTVVADEHLGGLSARP